MTSAPPGPRAQSRQARRAPGRTRAPWPPRRRRWSGPAAARRRRRAPARTYPRNTDALKTFGHKGRRGSTACSHACLIQCHSCSCLKVCLLRWYGLRRLRVPAQPRAHDGVEDRHPKRRAEREDQREPVPSGGENGSTAVGICLLVFSGFSASRSSCGFGVLDCILIQTLCPEWLPGYEVL